MTQAGAGTRQLRLRAVGGLRREAVNVAVEGWLGLETPVTPAAYSSCSGESIRMGVGVGSQCSGSRAARLSHMALGPRGNPFQEPMSKVTATWLNYCHIGWLATSSPGPLDPWIVDFSSCGLYLY